MTPCQMAGRPCHRQATTVVRIDGVGDRPLCDECLASLERMGMHFRRLDERAPLPAWRQRDLKRDQTGLVA